MTGQSAVTVIGLGAMGAGMAHSLLRAGTLLTVFNRTPAKAQPLAVAGAHIAGSAAEAVERADVVLLSLADEQAVDETFSSATLARLRPGTLVVDTSTVSPSFAHSARERLAERGARRVEACVIGNPRMSREGQLRVFAAGDEADVGQASQVLAACAQEIRYLGETGRASLLKLAFNLLLGVQTAGLAEAVTLVETGGMERATLLDALDNSGWRSPVLSFRAGHMRERSYQPAGFRAALMHKDLRLAAEEAGRYQVTLPVAERAADRYAHTIAAGRGDEDASVLVEVFPAG